MSAFAGRHGGGLSYQRMRSAVRRDSYSDYLPLVAWDPSSDAFLCIDDGWGHAWELVPSAYLFSHVHAALQGLLNIHFQDGTVLQVHTFADPLIDPALDAFLDLKTRDDPLIQASARRTADYLSEGRHGLNALHGIPIRNFRTFLSIKTRRPLPPATWLGCMRVSPRNCGVKLRIWTCQISLTQPGSTICWTASEALLRQAVLGGPMTERPRLQMNSPARRRLNRKMSVR